MIGRCSGPTSRPCPTLKSCSSQNDCRRGSMALVPSLVDDPEDPRRTGRRGPAVTASWVRRRISQRGLYFFESEIELGKDRLTIQSGLVTELQLFVLLALHSDAHKVACPFPLTCAPLIIGGYRPEKEQQQMAQKVHIVLEDDLDGSDATQTVLFGLDGT